MVVIVFFLILSFAALITRLQLQLLTGKGFIDTPNSRSSHQVPTPSSGGIALAIVFFLSYSFSCFYWQVTFFWPVLLVLPLALIGLFDDISPLSARTRLLVQLVFSVCLLFITGVFQQPVWFIFLLLVSVCWWLNLFNFMDGTDGLACGESIFICIGLLLLDNTGMTQESLALAVLLAACWGFLMFNGFPARIFMGDIGSMLLAGLLVCLALSLMMQQKVSAWSLLILIAGFASDSTMTLLLRALKGQKIWRPHRSHFYQGLARKWGNHESVAIVYSLVNVLFLLPLAYLANQAGNNGLFLTVIAYFPLSLAVIISHRRFLTTQ